MVQQIDLRRTDQISQSAIQLNEPSRGERILVLASGWVALVLATVVFVVAAAWAGYTFIVYAAPQEQLRYASALLFGSSGVVGAAIGYFLGMRAR